MRSLRGFFVPVLAAALCGCASSGDWGRMRWGVEETREEGVKLSLGEPGTDNLEIMMICRPHSGAVRVTVMERPGESAIVELRSGKVSHRYGGAGVLNEESGQMDLEFDARADDAVLARMAETGELTVVVGRRWMVTPAAFAPFHDFVSACRAPAG